MKRLFCSVATAIIVSASSAVWGQSPFPTRPITIVVPFPAGGTADLLPRLVAEKLRVSLGQPIIIENRSGASGNIGTEAVSRATPDGYTLVSAPQLTFSVNRLLNPNLRFDPRAMEPVSVLATYPNVLFGRADLPANSLRELIAYAKANPGRLSYASQGKGQIGHLTIEALRLRENLDIVHVPYRGSAPAINDLLAGQIDILTDNLLAGMNHVRNGKLKLLAVGGRERLKSFPDVATFAEVLPGFYSETWMAIAAPAGTPEDVTGRLSKAIADALQDPDLRRRITELQAEPFGSSPEEMRALIQQSYDRWSPVITQANIKED